MVYNPAHFRGDDERLHVEHAAVICSGHSIKGFDRTEGDGRTYLAVNEGLWACKCDAWLFANWRCWVWLYGGIGPLKDTPPPHVPDWIITGQYNAKKIRRKFDGINPGRIDPIERITSIPLALNWGSYSKTAAIAWAADNGAKRIDVHGDDMAGRGYFNHDEMPRGHPELLDVESLDAHAWQTMWTRQREITNNLVAHLTEKGCDIWRHTPDGPARYGDD